MVMAYLGSHQGADKATEARAIELIEKGYKRLMSFECRKNGFEWFGGDIPGHEAITSYGILEWTDMAKVWPSVDKAMMERTVGWLLSRRDGKGGFERNAKGGPSFGYAPQEITDAYITWALATAKIGGIEKELALVRSRSLECEDSYYLALAANVLVTAGGSGGAHSPPSDDLATKILDKLAKKQSSDGGVMGAATSICRSGGEALEIETTSLAILAWLRSPAHTPQLEKAMHWLLERAKGGRFGSTQSTILALKAIVAYDAAHATPKKPGAVLLVVDGKVYDEKRFSADEKGSIVLPSFAEALTPGEHKVELRLVGGTPMPYSLTV
ncbi:A-macroglobulin complement component, partial [bacterium]|nr:A-macroglobulin complement component [bacterium]